MQRTVIFEPQAWKDFSDLLETIHGARKLFGKRRLVYRLTDDEIRIISCDKMR